MANPPDLTNPRELRLVEDIDRLACVVLDKVATVKVQHTQGILAMIAVFVILTLVLIPPAVAMMMVQARRGARWASTRIDASPTGCARCTMPIVVV